MQEMGANLDRQYIFLDLFEIYFHFFYKLFHQQMLMADFFHKSLGDYVNEDVLVGVRPEDIYDRTFVSEPKEGSLFKAIVEVVEPMGNELFVYLKVGDDTLVARLNVQTEVEVNQEIELVANLNDLHVFDIKTGKTLT